MAARVDEVIVEADRPCPCCGGRAWWVAFLAGPASADGPGAFVELAPAPMARCAGCGLSARLDDDEIAWEP